MRFFINFMFHRNLTAAGDWVMGSGHSSFANEQDAVALNIKTRLSSWVGNCPYDLSAGIDWINRLDLNQAAQLRLDLSAVISKSYGVMNVTAVSAALDNRTRTFTVSYSVDTIYGQNFNATVDMLLGAQGN